MANHCHHAVLSLQYISAPLTPLGDNNQTNACSLVPVVSAAAMLISLVINKLNGEGKKRSTVTTACTSSSGTNHKKQKIQTFNEYFLTYPHMINTTAKDSSLRACFRHKTVHPILDSNHCDV